MMESWHPCRWGRRPGARIDYWIVSGRHGRLGGLGFCAAHSRDAAIGWSPTARAANLRLVVDTYRFLLLPGVAVANLASHVLSRAERRLKEDWLDRYGVVPQVLCTYVSPAHGGHGYRAAGWQHCRRLSDGYPAWRRRQKTTRCEVWLKPLQRDWRRTLGGEPRRRLGSWGELHVTADMDWSDIKYGRCSHPDGRLRKRIARLDRASVCRASFPLLRSRRPPTVCCPGDHGACC